MTVNKVKDFYENRSSDPRSAKLAPGIVSYFYRILKRFEITRIEKTYTLIEPGNRILDLGIGGGGLLVKCKINNKFKRYYGIDISLKVIKKTKSMIKNKFGGIGDFEFKVGDINNGIPYPNTFFDTVTCVAVLEHLFDPHHFVKEVNRVLKKGGKLIIEVPNLVWLPRRLTVLFGRLPITGNDVGWDAGHLHYFTFESLYKLFNKNGFKVEKETTSGIFCSVRQILPSLFGGDIIIKAIKK